MLGGDPTYLEEIGQSGRTCLTETCSPIRIMLVSSPGNILAHQLHRGGRWGHCMSSGCSSGKALTGHSRRIVRTTQLQRQGKLTTAACLIRGGACVSPPPSVHQPRVTRHCWHGHGISPPCQQVWYGYPQFRCLPPCPAWCLYGAGLRWHAL